MLLWQGSCVVHDEFKADDCRAVARASASGHPGPSRIAGRRRALADVVGSTTQLIAAAGRLDADTFIVATDQGILHDMRQRHPGKTFLAAPTAGHGATCKSCALCPWMAMNALDGVEQALTSGRGEIALDPAIALAARRPIERMLDFAAAARQPVRSSGDFARDGALYRHFGPA